MAPPSVRLSWGDRFGLPCLDSPVSVRAFTDPYGRQVRVDLYAVEASYEHCAGASIRTEPVIYREGELIGHGWPFARQEFGRLLIRDRGWLVFLDHCDSGKSLHAFVSVQGPSSRACL
jgi:hypothetical protein